MTNLNNEHPKEFTNLKNNGESLDTTDPFSNTFETEGLTSTVSEYKVMRSNAGYYIGRSLDEGDGYEMPYDRVGGYYTERSIAQAELDTWSDIPEPDYVECDHCGIVVPIEKAHKTEWKEFDEHWYYCTSCEVNVFGHTK